MKLIAVARIHKAFKVKGECSVYSFSGEEKHICQTNHIYLAYKKESLRCEVEYWRSGKEKLFLKLQGINTREHIAQYAQWDILISSQYIPNPREDEYYLFELIGTEVFTRSKNYVGEITSVYSAKGDSQAYLQIEGKLQSMLIPLTKKFFGRLDRTHRSICLKIPWIIE